MQTKFIMGIRSSVVLNKFLSNVLVMEELSEQDEAEIDNSAELTDGMCFMKKVGNQYVRIPSRDIFLYGEIDINNKADLELIKKADIITQEVNMAANIPSNFDYENGIVRSNKEGIFKTHDTWNKIDWFKFNHCLIGKPKRIIIYRIHKSYVKRNRSTIRRYNDC